MAIWPWRFFLKWALTYIYYIYGQHIGPTLLCCACRKTIICIFFCLENFPNIQLWKYTPAASWRKNEKNSNYISPVCLKSPFVWGPDRHQNSTMWYWPSSTQQRHHFSLFTQPNKLYSSRCPRTHWHVPVLNKIRAESSTVQSSEILRWQCRYI